jgi:FkbH-like protein
VKFTEAIATLQTASKRAPEFSVVLACGFTPMHLLTFLGAHLQRNLPDRRVAVTAGQYGDVAGTLESVREGSRHAVAVAIEWPDLDPRLGYRELGAWGPRRISEILADSRRMLDRLAQALENLPVSSAVSLPTLPLPPIFHASGWQATEGELILIRSVAEFAERIARNSGVRVLNMARLDEASPRAARFDLKSDLAAGLPYTLAHADAVGSHLAHLIAPQAPKKGIITDLDDTLWRGLVGEVGPDGVSWDLSSHHQLHGLYQKLLASLAEEGVLVGIASKNDPGVAAQALRREDLLLRPEHVFPVEAHWNPKSGSVARILEAWNIAADSVVFVDDSPMELAEVAQAHPGIECVQFPTADDREGYQMLRRLRDLFGKPRLAEEDALRLESIRRGFEFRENAKGTGNQESFLARAEAEITIDFAAGSDPRVLELVNKTNQFNLSGSRFSEADWTKQLAAPNAFVAAISYRDRFGPLGKIAVIEGQHDRGRIHVRNWVMSCRAFARRIEYACLQALYDRYGAEEMNFDFAHTPRNQPLQEFFASMLGRPPEPPLVLTRTRFAEACPVLYHQVKERSEIETPLYG